MSKTCPELLREAANLIEEALSRTPPAAQQSEVQPVASPSRGPAALSGLTPARAEVQPVASTSRGPAPLSGLTPARAEVARLFAPYHSDRRNRTRRPTQIQVIRRSYTHTFFCLAHSTADKVPSFQLKTALLASGLGEQRVAITGDDNDPALLTNRLFEVFPKLQNAGGFELLKIKGATRSRNLTLIPCPSTGYTLAYLKDPSTNIGQESSRPFSGPLISCLTCQMVVPYSKMKLHRASCNGTPVQETHREEEGDCGQENGSGTLTDRENVPVGPQSTLENDVEPEVFETEKIDDVEGNNDWNIIKDPSLAVQVFKEKLLQEHETGKPLKLRMDMRDSEEDRERALLAFYKQQQEWACPLQCILEGDSAIGQGVVRYFLTTIISKLQFGFQLNLGGLGKTLLFEGQPDHLVPAASEVLIESNIFHVAGRMMGHSILHDGPRLTGLSPAVVHVLLNGDPEMATIVIEDCPDLHIRSIITMAT
ncbi:uncharacterized protein LOC130929422 [Corythoichthys intestinalis]|uniref:uncharacterized protein LOC130929422 n=1 Tax=Corythoichthys intestinalis TaxID=161448 RepID=UPI0025A4F7C6|nr:uncharacterized protein LOC130929422 [Corythoichthys intestinalis]